MQNFLVSTPLPPESVILPFATMQNIISFGGHVIYLVIAAIPSFEFSVKRGEWVYMT
jgi:hypothetical protein